MKSRALSPRAMFRERYARRRAQIYVGAGLAFLAAFIFIALYMDFDPLAIILHLTFSWYGLSRPDTIGQVCSNSMLANVTRMSTSPYLIPVDPVHEDQFTVLIQTHARVDMARRVIHNMARMRAVRKIVVTWSNLEVTPPDFNSEVDCEVVVKKLTVSNDIGLRFDAAELIDTQGVLVIDDDRLVAEEDINHAFDVWRQHPYALVGFDQRGHGSYWTGRYGYRQRIELPLGYYSIILTTTEFAHREYLRKFMDAAPSGVRKMVHDHLNCEDIAMNFMVQDHCGCAGAFLVRSRRGVIHVSQDSGEGGLSWRTNHKLVRHKCLEVFAQEYGYMPLRHTRCVY